MKRYHFPSCELGKYAQMIRPLLYFAVFRRPGYCN